jgi:hypothetical protein
MSDWKVITEAEYFDALEVLPPAYHDHRGFLIGEPHDHRTCTVKGTLCAEYAAYVRIGDVCYGGRNLTVYEYRQLDLATVP